MTRQNWTTENINDLSGKLTVVTGANTGLGFEVTAELAAKNAEVIMAVRDLPRGEEARSRILEKQPDAKLIVMELDLSSLKSVRAFAVQFMKSHDTLDILINNAGVMMPPYGLTEDGFELQFGVNHLGHFALTRLLLPALHKAAAGRVVNVSSLAHEGGDLNFEDLDWSKREYSAYSAYSDSKLANIYFTYELSKKVAGSNVVVTSAHPGVTKTDLMRHSLLMRISSPLMQKAHMGALPVLRAACDADAKGNEYYGPGGFKGMRGYPVVVEPSLRSQDAAIAEKLWQASEELTRV